MILVLLSLLARADSGEDYAAGFAVATQAEVPSDSRLLYVASYAPQVTAVVDGEAPIALAVESVVAGIGGKPYRAVLPPTGGWRPGGAYTVTAVRSDGVVDELAFTAANPATSSAEPVDVVLQSMEVPAWSEPTGYPWGCCFRTREVRFVVTSAATDPWSYAELWGEWPGPSQMAESPEIWDTLGIGVGPGEHTLTYLQWLDDEGLLWPACFEVAHVSSGDARRAGERVCPDAAAEGTFGPDEVEGTDSGAISGGSGCRTAGPDAAFVAILLATLLARVRRRDQG